MITDKAGSGTDWILDLDLFVVLRRVQQPGSYCDG